MAIGVAAILLMALLASVTHGVTVYNTGAGKLYTLKVVKDVTLERSTTNYNNLIYLLVSKHPDYPNKRSLVQFENLPTICPLSHIKSAKMYLYYKYAHKASFHTIEKTPFIPRYMYTHLVKKYWSESQATSTKRYSSQVWSAPWLALDGRDAELEPQDWNPVTIHPLRPEGFVEFDVTSAIRKWRSGVPNYGLVIRAFNELQPGRDIRFYSNKFGQSSKHASVRVLCKG